MENGPVNNAEYKFLQSQLKDLKETLEGKDKVISSLLKKVSKFSDTHANLFTESQFTQS